MLLEINNLQKYFKVKKGTFGGKKQIVRAVDNVTLDMKEGEDLSLVGESGSGKTTLGRLILKLMPRDKGQILFDGKDITRMSQRRMRAIRRDMQMVFQDPFSSLDPRFTVRDIIMEALTFDASRNRQQKQDHIGTMLKAVGLSPDVSQRFPHEFSGGERQRIAIARALVMNPKLLILDEAVSSLDVLVQQQIVDLLFELKKEFNLTYLFISHNLRVVKKISQKIAVMYRGKIVEYGPADVIFNNPMHPCTKDLLLAALEYKAAKRAEPYDIPADGKLISCGGEHFIYG